MSQRNQPCWCGSGKKTKKCHPHTPPPGTHQLKTKYLKNYQIVLKTPEQIQGIRKACELTANILMETCALAKEGVTTLELNDFAHKKTLEAGATPACLHYGHPPFPKSICTSLNEVICHGIPDKTPLKEGDILNIDISCILDGYYGDCSRMVSIGKITAEKERVIEAAYGSLMQSIEILKPGVLTSAIGDAITTYATSKNCSVVYQFVGHGVGCDFHEEPQIFHHRNNQQIPLAPGMTFTIEPMINAGVPEGEIDPDDQWTARTLDGKPSAQFEHTLLITETGVEILTPWTYS